MYINNYTCRRRQVFFVFFIFFLVCLLRLFFIQGFCNQYLTSLAKKQQSLYIELEPRRGTIFDRNLKPLVINLPCESLYAVPKEITDKHKTANLLLPILNVDYDYLSGRLSRLKSFIWLARKLPDEVVESIKALNLKGLYFIKENKRVYPNLYLASHVIGFAGLDNKGLEGIELYYDSYLRGIPGWGVILRDARQAKLGLWQKLVLPCDGYNLRLTIDEVIQVIVEQELDRLVQEFHPKGASIIVMEPTSGEILALANRPNFDLNKAIQTDSQIRRNRLICDLFEPGSVFKIVTASAALEESVMNEQERIFCENGAYRVANHTLHDHRPHGWLTFSEVIEQSSNIGVTKIAQSAGKNLIYQYIRRFGFGKKLGVDLPGEITGMIKEPKYWSKTSIGAVPIGQEVGVTALQLASAISVVANQGRLMKPYIVREIQDKYGETIKRSSPQVLGEAISAQTALRLKEILVRAVENGTGKMARVEGIRVAGKTGTAQKLEPDGRYSHNKFVASFIGFAPADNPKIALVIVVDEPRPYYFGGVVCAPAFKNIAAQALKYLEGSSLVQEVKKENQ